MNLREFVTKGLETCLEMTLGVIPAIWERQKKMKEKFGIRFQLHSRIFLNFHYNRFIEARVQI